jgi:hypothetical protein
MILNYSSLFAFIVRKKLLIYLIIAPDVMFDAGEIEII